MAFDINAIQSYLPPNLQQGAYNQAGGTPDNYANWLQSNIQSNIQNSSYVTMDPSYTFSQNIKSDPFASSGGYGYNITTEDEKNSRQQAANDSAAQMFGQTNNVNSNTNSATPGAIDKLAGGPDLKNRKPSLAAGWGGWDAGSTNGPAGNANFTYFSRFS